MEWMLRARKGFDVEVGLASWTVLTTWGQLLVSHNPQSDVALQAMQTGAAQDDQSIVTPFSKAASHEYQHHVLSELDQPAVSDHDLARFGCNTN
jgi:hypothetical protein